MPWLTTSQASRRLGVKPPTLYAYVSRGLLHSQRDPDTRRSRFDAREVEQLAVRGRPRQASRSPSLDIQIETHITEIADHAIRYRGLDVLALARSATFEQVAGLIWAGSLSPIGRPWQSHPVDLGSLVGDRVAPRMSDRLRLVVSYDAIGASRRRDRETVIEEGSRLIATLIDSLPLAGPLAGVGRCPQLVLPDGVVVRGSLAGRLWARLSPRRATPTSLATLNAALVLLADHEMAASTLAARVAASTRAGVHDVVGAGLGALNGPLHGGESERVRRLLRRAADSTAAAAVAEVIERHGRVPGFGQVLYPDGDPRAVLLLQMLNEAAPHPSLDVVEAVVADVARRRLPAPNVDLALAALGMVADMPDDAGTAIFSAARVAGWLAHAMEEYEERPLRFRPRAVYVGADDAGADDAGAENGRGAADEK